MLIPTVPAKEFKKIWFQEMCRRVWKIRMLLPLCLQRNQNAFREQ